MIAFAKTGVVLLATVALLPLVGCNRSPEPEGATTPAGSAAAKPVEKGDVQRYLREASDEELLELVEPRRVVDRYLQGADAESAKAIVIQHDLIDRYLQSVEPEQVLEVVEQLRAAVSELFLTPDPDLVQQYAKIAETPDAGVARLLSRGPFDGLTTGRGGGAYYSFTTRSNDYESEPHLQLQRGTFSSGFTGGQCGCVQVLESTPLELVSLEDFPDLLLTDKEEFCQQGRSRGCMARAEMGATYALRFFDQRGVGIFVAFSVVQVDGYGVTIVWRRLSGPSPVGA